MMVARTSEVDGIFTEHLGRTLLVVDIGAVADEDQLCAAFVRQLRTEPQMDPTRPMHWDALVDGVGNGIDLAAPRDQGVVLIIGPADLLRERDWATLDELMSWLDQLEERVQPDAGFSPRLVCVLHGHHASFRRRADP